MPHPFARLSKTLVLAALLSAGGVSLAQTASTAELAGPTLDIRRYLVDGDLPLSSGEIDALLAPFAGEKKTLRDIEGAAKALEGSLRSRGYVFHRIFVPEQKPVNGEIRLGVVTIRLGQVEVVGNANFSQENIRRSLASMHEGQAPQVQMIGRDVTASNANPAKQVTVTFKESSQPNAVDAVVRVKDSPPMSFFASLTANESVSGDPPRQNTHRVSGGFQHANLFDRDHVMTVSYTTDPGNLSDVSLIGVYYQVPLYGTGMNLSAAYTSSDVDSGRVQQGANVFDVSGSGRFTSFKLTRALDRVGALQQTLGIGLDDRYFRNKTTFNGALIQPNVGSRVLTLQYQFRTEPSWGVVGGNLDYVTNIGGGSGNTVERHLANGGTKKNWQAWRFNVEAATLVSDWQLTGRLKGQYSGDNLIAGEQIGLGGANSVRGFADRVVSGDYGHQWNVEAMGPALGEWKIRPVVFVEGGSVTVRRGASESIMGVGAGLRVARDNWQVGLDLAQAVDRDSAETARRPVRMHLAMSVRF